MTVTHFQNILPADRRSLFLGAHKFNVQIIAGAEGVPYRSAEERLPVEGGIIFRPLEGHHHGDHSVSNFCGIHLNPFTSCAFIIRINLCLNLTLQFVQTVVGR